MYDFIETRNRKCTNSNARALFATALTQRIDHQSYIFHINLFPSFAVNSEFIISFVGMVLRRRREMGIIVQSIHVPTRCHNDVIFSFVFFFSAFIGDECKACSYASIHMYMAFRPHTTAKSSNAIRNECSVFFLHSSHPSLSRSWDNKYNNDTLARHSQAHDKMLSHSSRSALP